MKQEMKVSFYLKKNEVKKDGACPVMARLTVGKTTTAFSTKLSVQATLWSGGRATGKSLSAHELNRELDGLRASAVSSFRELSALKEKISADEVKTRMLGMASGQETLLTYFRAHNENFDKKVGVNREADTAKSYWNTLAHLRRFLKAKYNLSDIPFTALNKSFIEKFDLYLRIEAGLALGSIVLNTTRLNTIINKAITEGIITADPFTGYEAERPEPEPKDLSRKELDRLMSTPLTKASHYLIRDMFLFSCYTGMPYSDMRKLSDKDITTDESGTVWVKTKRKKTKVEYEVPLLELPLQILDRYRGTAPDGRILPMLGNQEMNRQLKDIACTCGIERRLTFHCGRHTFGSETTLSQGVPLETVSRMMGHNKVKTTQIYARLTDEKIGEDMKALEKRIAGKFKFAI